MGEVSIEEATTVDDTLVDAFVRLTPQLSRSSPPPTAAELREIVDDPRSILFVARDAAGAVVGTLTLVTFRIPTGLRAWIEDVIVDEAARGKKVGERLTRAAIERAGALGAKTVDLTSRPAREAANRLYQKVGFELRETNVYRIVIGNKDDDAG